MRQQTAERDQRPAGSKASGKASKASSSSSSSSSSNGVPAALGPLTDLTRDEGLCLYALGRWAEAAEALGSYLEGAPSAPDSPMIQTVLEKVRAAQRRAAAKGGGEGEPGDGAGGAAD